MLNRPQNDRITQLADTPRRAGSALPVATCLSVATCLVLALLAIGSAFPGAILAPPSIIADHSSGR